MNYLSQGAQKMGLLLTPEQRAAFQCYQAELLAWNARANLTAITSPKGIQVKHFLDSLSCLKVISDARFQPPGATIKLIDVGSGAGFPGLPLKIVYPSMHLTLVEAIGKKVKFLKHIVAALGLRNVTVLKARAEEVGRDADHRERYDWAVARAVAEMPTLVEYLLPLIRLGGRALAQKGENAPAEVASAEAAIQHLGGRVNCLLPLELHGIAETRYLVVIDKIAATSSQHPRRVGVPTKRPIRGEPSASLP